jgi:multicomponent Na+:H+ antiporter subunit F
VSDLLWVTAIALVLMTFACVWRAEVGPTVQDRVLAVNVAGTKTLVVLAILARIAGHTFLLDAAIVYGLLNFVITIAVTRFIESGRLGREVTR